MRNTAGLSSEEFAETKTAAMTVEDIEEQLIEEHKNQLKLDSHDSAELTRMLMKVLDAEKEEGETITTFENRIKSELSTILNV